MAETGCYSDGVTKFTDPFYQCVCRGCLHRFWSVIITSPCPECGCSDVFRTFDRREVDAESARLKNK